MNVSQFFIVTISLNVSRAELDVRLKVFQENYRQIMIRGNSEDLTKIRGFTNVNHTVQTSDGYLLSIFRIRAPSIKVPHYPFIILHGLFSDSESFQRASDGFFSKDQYIEFEDEFTNRLDTSCDVLPGKERIGRMLAYHLAICGYDVWLMNVRDSPQYSKHAVWRKNIDPEFWNTTLDSYTEDLRAVLNHVLATTGWNTSALLCHSAGCSTALQLMIDHPETNHQLRPVFLVAPYVYTGSIFSVLLVSSYLGPIYQNYLSSTWSFREASEVIVQTINENQWFRRLYGSLFSFLGGYSSEEFDWSRIDRMASHIPGTSASKLVAHIGQRRDRDSFSRFDYKDSELNMKAYGQNFAPEYDLTRITNPNMILFTGLYDTIAPYPAMERLKNALKVPLLAEIRTPNSHMDFIFGKSVNSTLNLHVFRWLKRLNL